jgi:hypothetical protein
MAKRQKTNIITTSFHYLTKTHRDEGNSELSYDTGFSAEEFQRIVARISNPAEIDDNDEKTIQRIKLGQDLPFTKYEVVDEAIHFGDFEGAYYGQQYRNNRAGVISADSLNLRVFHYLVTLLRDGKILVGVSYNGQFGDYDGIRQCFSYLLRGAGTIASRTIKNVAHELGDGRPIDIKLTFRKASERPEHRNLFGRAGMIAIKGTEYGADFADDVNRMAKTTKGTVEDRKKYIAELVNESGFMELDDDEIMGCTALVREKNGRTKTVYLLGENNFSTKYALDVVPDIDGIPDRNKVRDEMVRIMRTRIIPLMVG